MIYSTKFDGGKSSRFVVIAVIVVYAALEVLRCVDFVSARNVDRGDYCANTSFSGKSFLPVRISVSIMSYLFVLTFQFAYSRGVCSVL